MANRFDHLIQRYPVPGIEKFIQALKAQSKAISSINQKVNNLKVYQVTSEVSNAIKVSDKQREIQSI